MSQACGVGFAYRDGSDAGFYQLLESVGGGLASFDFDRDGWQDLFFTGGGSLVKSEKLSVAGRASALFRNSHGGKFSDITHSAGLEADDLYTHGCTVADLDADGFDDLVVAGFGDLQVWQNRGDGSFAEVSELLGIRHAGWNVTAAAGDYDRDGLVDLYLLTYADWQPDAERRCFNDQKMRDICGPTLFPGSRDALFRNLGERFEEVTERARLVEQNRGLGVVAADLNQDDWLDFAVVNDVQENQLYLNDRVGSFEEKALLAGIAYSKTGEREGSMGIDASDFDGDGLLDLWYTNYTQQDNSLLRNTERGGFVHSADLAGLGSTSRVWVGFGTGFADFNCDGWDDLYVINGHVAYERRDSPYFQPSQLFESREGKRYVEVSDRGGPYFDVDRSGRGSAKTDFDNDGAWDLVISHQNDPVAVLRNRHTAEFWIRLELIGVSSDRNAVGASASVTVANRKVKKWKIGGGSYLSHADPRLLLILDGGEPVEVTVSWPDGASEKFPNLSANSTHALVQGRGAFVAPGE
ncbi:MAG TPA: CRTAC1 family protein [Planctomycetaceae bacterium]|nr:CRTAC1 family protein [Planctomycetaceae bacterium]